MGRVGVGDQRRTGPAGRLSESHRLPHRRHLEESWQVSVSLYCDRCERVFAYKGPDGLEQMRHDLQAGTAVPLVRPVG